ncbi:protein UPSTREAM OF FLC isoform X2 [Sesamum indicum]|uniref:Protein UPSTREAM OF FLC isoform X2 n=1 Tax=Sesamum indicum TaxID=4182 RepID=A0A6I9TLS2_SESIN|nr:protein UPSTREAM OF FLC isoform X2 [Sesamum indicum]
MEAQGGAQVRRLHIVYFLSRKGRIEHPHLVRVHHLSRNGVRLRDVKRWLGELRGKDMPESFSWSYKRRYKTGYVWQDLLDDDLITPISDNEYVLKGSEISSSNIKAEEKVVKQKHQTPLQEKQKTIGKEDSHSHNSSETSMYVSTKSSSEIEEESPTFSSDTSTLTDDSGKPEMEKNSDTTKHENPDNRTDHPSPTFGQKNKKRSSKVTINENITTTSTAADASKIPSSEPQFTKSKSYSNGASHIFRNLISCGAVETNDSAVVAINKQNRPTFLNMCASDASSVHSAQICKRDGLGGSQRVLQTPHWVQQQWTGSWKGFDGPKDSAKNKSEVRDQRATSAAYKPVNGPTCSQCGKPFKPEKLHAHMKSCKGMKALSKGAANAAISAAEKAPKGSTTGFRNHDSISVHLLTH